MHLGVGLLELDVGQPLLGGAPTRVLDENIAVTRSYLAGTGPFPERVAVLAVTGQFMTDFADMVGAWAQWATKVIETWPDDPRAAAPRWDVFEAIAARDPDRPEVG